MIVWTCYYISKKDMKEEKRMSTQERHWLVSKAIKAGNYKIKRVTS